MAYFTKQQARDAARSAVRKSYTANSAQGVINESIRKASTQDRFDVFLSHSINDAELVLGVKTLLEQEGLKVYIDWDSDPQLSRATVNKETAALLRIRMKQSNSLIYIATDNSSSSKWMPWELGFFDGYKPDAIGILPLMDNESSYFKGQEYLSLYPVISKGNYKSGGKEIFVMTTKNWTNLKNFSSGNPNWRSF